MSQDQIIKWLQSHPGQKFTSLEMKEHLNLSMSVYTNIQKIRSQADKGLLPELRYEFKASGGKYHKSAYYWWEDKKLVLTEEEWGYFWKTEELTTKILMLLTELERLQEQLHQRMDGCLTIRSQAFKQYPHKKRVVEAANLIQVKQMRLICGGDNE